MAERTTINVAGLGRVYRAEQVDELVRAARPCTGNEDLNPASTTLSAVNRASRFKRQLEDSLKPFPDPEPEGEAG